MSAQVKSAVALTVMVSGAVAKVDYSCLHSTSWIINEDGDYSEIFNTETDVTQSMLSGGQWTTFFNKIPKYNHIMTDDDISFLNSRPKASSDFSGGQSSAVSGQTYSFGSDIGYVSDHCTLGWWPPGPECPSVAATTSSWTLSPAPENRDGGCYTPMLGSIGTWVNGVSIFGASDGQSYNNQNVWHNSAVAFEYYDLDQCNGHAVNGEYHHHHMPVCIQARLQDDGSQGHSPIYGWLHDGYPMYGPYQAANVLATSCWKPRDYSSGSATGCGDGARVANLLTRMITPKAPFSTVGPDLDGTVTTQSGNTISAHSGIFREDYYFDSACTGGSMNEYLDSFNGHDHDGLGYHYHVTIDADGAGTYPYMAGPKYYGCRAAGLCCTTFDDMQCRSASSVCGSSESTSTHACSMAESPTGSLFLSAKESSQISSEHSWSLAFGLFAGIAVLMVAAVSIFTVMPGRVECTLDEDEESKSPFINDVRGQEN